MNDVGGGSSGPTSSALPSPPSQVGADESSGAPLPSPTWAASASSPFPRSAFLAAYGLMRDAAQIASLHALLKPYLLRRLKVRPQRNAHASSPSDEGRSTPESSTPRRLNLGS